MESTLADTGGYIPKDFDKFLIKGVNLTHHLLVNNNLKRNIMKKSCLIVLGCVLFLTSCENTTAQNGSKQSKKAYDKSKSEIKNKGSNFTLAPDFELADLEGNKFKLSSSEGRLFY